MTQYKPNIPQPGDLISVSQDHLLRNFQYLNTFLDVEHQQSGLDTTATGSGRHRTVSMPNSGTINIASITPSVSPTTITTAAPLPATFMTGDSVYIKEATGTVQTVVENKSFIATVTGASTFTIPVNTNGLTYNAGTGYIGINPAVPAGSTEILYTNNGNLFSRNSLRVMNITGGAGSFPTNGYINLSANFVLQYGFITGAPIANGQAVAFAVNFSAPPFSICITGETASSDDKTINITAGAASTSGFTVICSGTSNFTKLYYMAIGFQ